jgi:hypothetical protein
MINAVFILFVLEKFTHSLKNTKKIAGFNSRLQLLSTVSILPYCKNNEFVSYILYN